MQTDTADGLRALEAIDLSKRFGENMALRGVDLTVERGEIHALLGENGSGKSTLIKILAGFHRPDAGRALIDGHDLAFGQPKEPHRLGARFVHQDLGLIETASVLDNLALGAGYQTRLATIRPRANLRAARVMLQRVGLNVDPRRQVETLSASEKTGVAIARALQPSSESPARLLVLDEPTATLPIVEVEHLMAMVRQVAASGVGVVYVSHRLDEVFQLCDMVTVLRDGARVATREVAGLTHRSLVDLIVGDELADARSAADVLTHHVGAPGLTLHHVSGPSLDDVSVEFRAGQVTGIAGLTGSGRDTLLGALFGAVPRRGEVTTGDGTRIKPMRPRHAMQHSLAYVPSERKTNGGVMHLPAHENLSLTDLRPFSRLATVRTKAERAEARQWFERLDVRPRQAIDLPLESFSGGNQQKVVFGKWMRRNPRVFLLDEPTQGVDAGARAALHQLLVQAAADGATVIVSSSEAEELAAICQRVLVFCNGRVSADLKGADISVRALNAASLDKE